jgi:hypothetical protein
MARAVKDGSGSKGCRHKVGVREGEKEMYIRRL